LSKRGDAHVAAARAPTEADRARVHDVNVDRRGNQATRELERAGVRILVAEDNLTNQQVALGILRKLGFDADVVASGKEAVEALQSIAYDLVLMDVQMPEMDGLEATRSARANGVLNRAVPIIAMTAHALQRDREACLEAGMDDYIAKPVTPAALEQTLETWLTRVESARKIRAVPSWAGPVESLGADRMGDSDAPIFSESALLERLMGDRELGRVVARGFLGDIPKQLQALGNFLDASDAKGTEHQAHTLKGAAAAVGAEALEKLAYRLEQAGKAGCLGTVRAALGELQNQFDQLKKAMEASALLDDIKETRA
jgi:CheY-like chemotaxis protein/HPt (histidine-containing phosphotransfer) domain-containing protein